MGKWISLEPHWATLERIAQERDEQKREFHSSRYWNRSSHFVGLCGELIYALETGQEIDATLRILGDGGQDFPGVDVKTTIYWRDPYLKHPVDPKFWPEKFALVAVDIERKRGRLALVVDRDALRRAPIKDWGHGPQYSLGAWPEDNA